MKINDYSDTLDYYTQDFRVEGFVSIWFGQDVQKHGIDVLQDCCGVGYYNLDDQEMNNLNFELVPIEGLLEEISYSEQFLKPTVLSAAKVGITEARWVIVQFDFRYRPSGVKRIISADPVFVGSFVYAP